MITAIVEAGTNAESLAVCLAALVPAAVDGVVREVILVAVAPDQAILGLAEDSGAAIVATRDEAIKQARSDWLLILDEPVRLEDGWHGEAAVHAQRHGARAARFRRAGVLGWFRWTGRLARKDRLGAYGRLRIFNSRAFPA